MTINRMMIPLLLAATTWGPPPVQLAIAPAPPDPPRPPRAPDPTSIVPIERMMTFDGGTTERLPPPRIARIEHVETRQARRTRDRQAKKLFERGQRRGGR